MENRLSVVAVSSPDVEPVQSPVRPVVAQAARAPSATAAPEPDLRLVIEEGQAGSFVYKTVDRRTGEVILQLPREEVLRMRDADAYSAGAVITTQV